MILNLDFVNGYYIVKLIHSFISFTFLVFALWIVIRSVHGIVKSKAYSKLDKFLSYGFIISLYLQLIFGLILFSNMGSTQGYSYPVALTGDMASKRMWPIEHIVLMLFALFIANLGLIISLKTSDDKDKHQKILIYYVIAILLIALSLSFNYFF